MITAANNGRIKGLVQLNQKAKARREKDLFIVEGLKMFMEAPDSHILEVYISESFAKRNVEKVKSKLNKCNVEMVSDDVFAKVADTKTPQGILCVMKQFHYQMEEMLQEESPFFMILEDIQDPGNLGTILRAGEGAGITGVIMSKDTVDIYNPKTIRGTMGSIYRVPFIYIESLEEAVLELKRSGVCVYAAHLSGEKNYDTFDLTRSMAMLIGNEGKGLKEKTAELADCYLKIPMLGEVESLNAAVAASVLMYETARQRRK